MKIYISYCKDRHYDPVVRAFRHKDDAIDFTKKFMLSYMSHPEKLEENDHEGYELYLTYVEEDHAFVKEVELE